MPPGAELIALGREVDELYDDIPAEPEEMPNDEVIKFYEQFKDKEIYEWDKH